METSFAERFGTICTWILSPRTLFMSWASNSVVACQQAFEYKPISDWNRMKSDFLNDFSANAPRENSPRGAITIGFFFRTPNFMSKAGSMENRGSKKLFKYKIS